MPDASLMGPKIEPATGRFWLILGSALALSIGWGIRGNFGHETGAMIPGALAAMAAALLAGREDWWARVPYFGFFGALGWSFGGSISYMQVIAYTHSGHSLSVWYGFASLFWIGFLWAAFGGAGTALPTVLSLDELRSLFAPITAVFIGWCLQDAAISIFNRVDSAFRQNDPLYWYDTDWLGAAVAIISVGVLALFRRRVDAGTSLIWHMAIGWWAGFLILVVGLGWRMTPPRGDNWAGCTGMVLGLLLWLYRRGRGELVYATILAGIVGGVGFAGGDALKLLGIRSGWETNWHSLLEQTYGFINGLGIGLMMLWLKRRVPLLTDVTRPGGHWTRSYATLFVLVGITYLNFLKNPASWLKAGTMPAEIYGLSPVGWYNFAYLLLGALLLTTLLAHRRRPIPFLSGPPAGRGQLMFLVFLAWVVVGNFERVVVAFAPQRIVTEGVIFANAILCAGIVALACRAVSISVSPALLPSIRIKTLLAIGVVVFAITTVGSWAAIRAIYGDTPASHASLHIRFGPKATATKSPPSKDKPHP